jgi:hypothetical protein
MSLNFCNLPTRSIPEKVGKLDERNCLLFFLSIYPVQAHPKFKTVFLSVQIKLIKCPNHQRTIPDFLVPVTAVNSNGKA